MRSARADRATFAIDTSASKSARVQQPYDLRPSWLVFDGDFLETGGRPRFLSFFTSEPP